MKRSMIAWALTVAVCLWVGGCVESVETPGPSLVETEEVEPGDECAAGGRVIITGRDDDRDGELGEDEVDEESVVCHGEDGRDGEDGDDVITETKQVEAGEECQAGGTLVESGRDENGNGRLDEAEVEHSYEVCDGVDGEDGADGDDAVEALIETTSSEDCEAGGVEIAVGMDEDGDGELSDEEVSQTTEVCHGAAGEDADDLVVAKETEAMGSNCHYGGEHIEIGRDTDGDGELSEGEVEESLYSCFDWMPKLSADGSNSCGIKEGGEVQCWGAAQEPENDYISFSTAAGMPAGYGCGLRPDSTIECAEPPATTPSPGVFSEVSCQIWHCCALDSQGQVECWGWDNYGQSSPPSGEFETIEAGYESTCALDTSDEIECWGNDSYGKSSSPSGSFEEVSSDDEHTCGIETDGTIECWGNTSSYTVPSGTYETLALGSGWGCAVDDNGALDCWGSSDGKGATNPPSGDFVQVVAGASHACAVETDRTVECWGSNYNGAGAATVPSDFP